MGIRSITLMILVSLFCLGTPVSAQRSPKVCLYFFYGVGCPECAKVELHIGQLEQKYPQLEVHRFEAHQNRTNLQLLKGLFEQYRVP